MLKISDEFSSHELFYELGALSPLDRFFENAAILPLVCMNERFVHTSEMWAAYEINAKFSSQ